jgi:hypothetical protein
MQQSGRLQDDGGTQNSCRVVRCQAFFPVREFWLSPVTCSCKDLSLSGGRTSEREETILTRGAQAMKSHQDAVIRLAEVPGLGVDSVQRIIAEAGAQASTFPSVARRKAINACAEC